MKILRETASTHIHHGVAVAANADVKHWIHDMTRKATQYASLDRLEDELAKQAIKEFNAMIERRGSFYLYGLLARKKAPGSHRIIKNDELEKKEKDILLLRNSLGEEVPGPVLRVIHDFVDKMVEGHFLVNRSLCHQAIDELKSLTG